MEIKGTRQRGRPRKTRDLSKEIWRVLDEDAEDSDH